jgi:hypothetical protein
MAPRTTTRPVKKSGEGFVAFCVLTSLLLTATRREGEHRPMLLAVCAMALAYATRAMFARISRTK